MDLQAFQVASPRLVLDHVFEDMDTYGSAVGGWDLDFRQLDAGALEARASLVVGAKSVALRVSFNRRLHQQGSPPTGALALGLPNKPLNWCGVQVSPGEVINFNLPQGFQGLSEACFSGTVLLLDPREMEQRAAELGLDLDVGAAVARVACWRGSEVASEHLRRRLEKMFRSFREPGGEMEANALVNHDVLTGLLRAMVVSEEAPLTRARTARSRALRVALEILDDPAALPLSVLDLCRAADVSPATLYRAFQESFGVGPKRYLQIRSLSGVRHDLLTAPADSLVIEIANRWGFWHMGQFAADYRRQFGELPSETLARR
jgi:AraC-like DNA-binding protein